MSLMTKEIEVFFETIKDKKSESNIILVELLHSIDKRLNYLEDKVEELESNKRDSTNEQGKSGFSIS